MNSFSGILAEIADVIGTPDTIRIIRSYGGSKLVIPKKPTETMLLCQTIGLEQAKLLSKQFGGDTLWIPMLYFRGKGEQRVRISRKLKAGYSVNRIVREEGISDRTVYRLKNKDYDRLPLLEYIKELEEKDKENPS